MRAPITVLVAGGTGYLGSSLVAALRERGDQAKVLTRGAPGPGRVHWDPTVGELDPHALEGVDVVVNLVGAGVADRRWTARRRDVLLTSRTWPTALLARRVADARGAGTTPVTALVQGSAIGWYGSTGEHARTEAAPAGDGFLADLVMRWEAAATPAAEAGVRVAYARTGIVLSPDAAALGRLLPLVRLGLAGRLGTGEQWWSWISKADEVRALLHLVDSPLSGPVNLTAPHPARNVDLTRAVARAWHRPARLRVPTFALRLALGELSGELLGSQRVVPHALEQDGFTFLHPHVDDAAAWARSVA